MPNPWSSRLRFPGSGLVLPIGAMVGIQEKRTLLSKTTWKRSLNGTAVPLRPLYGTLFGVTFSASGDAVRWTPNFTALPLDQWFTALCTKHMSCVLPAGQTTVNLPRDPSPGQRIIAFRASDRTEVPVAVDAAAAAALGWTGPTFTLSGPTNRTITFTTAFDEDVVIQFLPSLHLVLAGYDEGAPEIEGKADWSLSCEEYQPDLPSLMAAAPAGGSP